MATAPHVSVVVPFRRADARLARCVESLLGQDAPDGGYELILVHNGPAGERPVPRYPGVTHLFEPRAGAYAARNRGASEATGSVIAFVDADCVPDRDWLRGLTARLRDSGAAVAVGRIDPGGSSRGLELLTDCEESHKAAVLDGDRCELYFACAGNMAVRRDVWLADGPFAERPRGSDTKLVQDIARRGHRRPVAYAPHARVRHLELRRPVDHYRKLLVYGRSARLSLGTDRAGLPRGVAERLGVYAGAVQRRGLALTDAALLVPMLGVSRVCWGLGYWSGALPRRRA